MEKKNEKKKENELKKLDYEPECGFAHDAIPVDTLILILEKFQKSICKIVNDYKRGTGFLSKIYFPNTPSNSLTVLFTCNHVLSENDLIEGNKFQVCFPTIQGGVFTITMDKSRKFYTSTDFDTTIIEIKHTDRF